MTTATEDSGGVVGRALAGAALAGMVVGLGEAAIVIVERHLGLNPSLIFFALFFYGGIAAAIGLGIGIVLSFVTRSGATAFGLSGLPDPIPHRLTDCCPT